MDTINIEKNKFTFPLFIDCTKTTMEMIERTIINMEKNVSEFSSDYSRGYIACLKYVKRLMDIDRKILES